LREVHVLKYDTFKYGNPNDCKHFTIYFTHGLWFNVSKNMLCTKDISDIIRWYKYLIEAMMIFVLIGSLPNSERHPTFKVLQWTPSSSLINCTWNFSCGSESLHFRTDSMPHISHSSFKRSPVFKDHYIFESWGDS
jgi:hypothetical protein